MLFNVCMQRKLKRRSHLACNEIPRPRGFSWRRKWQPTPVFLPGESQGWRSLVGCHLWGRTESDTTEATQQQQQGLLRWSRELRLWAPKARGIDLILGGSDGKESALVRNLPTMQGTRVRFLGREDPLRQGMATHSSILVWRIPWTEEPGGLQSTGSQRVGRDWGTNLFTFSFGELRSHMMHSWIKKERKKYRIVERLLSSSMQKKGKDEEPPEFSHTDGGHLK